jgi:hypothetical protein
MKAALALCSLAALFMLNEAVAGGLRPLQANTFRLGNHIANVFYTQHDEYYRVVTMLGPDEGREGVPMRFVTHLVDGQDQTISVGAFDAGARPAAIRIQRNGDAITATLVADSMIASQ